MVLLKMHFAHVDCPRQSSNGLFLVKALVVSAVRHLMMCVFAVGHRLRRNPFIEAGTLW